MGAIRVRVSKPFLFINIRGLEGSGLEANAALLWKKTGSIESAAILGSGRFPPGAGERSGGVVLVWRWMEKRRKGAMVEGEKRRVW
jgi:hypothetical protein